MCTENLKAKEKFQEDANHVHTLESCAFHENIPNDGIISDVTFDISSFGYKYYHISQKIYAFMTQVNYITYNWQSADSLHCSVFRRRVTHSATLEITFFSLR